MRSQLTLVGLLNVSGKPKSLTKCTNHHQIMALCQTYAKLIYVRVKFNFLIFRRLLAVPFWIVERAREIAERKTGANERRGLGERREKGKKKQSLLVFFSSLQFFARLFRAPSRLSRKGLLAVYIFRYEKVNEFIAFTKNQSYFCFILVGELRDCVTAELNLFYYVLPKTRHET